MSETQTKAEMLEKLIKGQKINNESKEYSVIASKKLKEAKDSLDLIEKKIEDHYNISVAIKRVKIETSDFIIDTLKNLLSISFTGFIAISSIESLNKNLQTTTLILSSVCFILIVGFLINRSYIISQLEKDYKLKQQYYLKVQEEEIEKIKSLQIEVKELHGKIDVNLESCQQELNEVEKFLTENK